MDFDLKTTFPPGALSGGDRRRSFRNTVAGRVRRRANRRLKERVRQNQQIAEGIAESIEFEQRTEADTLTFMFTSDHPAIENYMLGTPRLKDNYSAPPPISRGEHDIAGWAERHGKNPYEIQAIIFKFGTPEHPEVASALEGIVDELEGVAATAALDWMIAYGDERLISAGAA